MLIKDWLRRSPQPEIVKVAGTAIQITEGRKKWQDLTATIETTAKSGDKIVCLKNDGTILRATVYEGDGELATVPVVEEAASKAATESELVLIARLLKDAGDAGADRFRDMFKIAFEAQNDLMRTFASRLSSLESAWGTATNEIAKANATIIQLAAERDAAQQAQESPGGSVEETVVRALMGGVTDGQEAAKASGKSNGKANGKARVES